MQPETLTQPVALPRDACGMSPEETLYRLFEEHVEPKTFHGMFGDCCLTGQTCVALGLASDDRWGLAQRVGVAPDVVETIYYGASAAERNLPDALAMAREVLGLNDAR